MTLPTSLVPPGAASDCGEAGPDPQAAPDGGQGVATIALQQQQQQQQADREEGKPDVAQQPPTHLQQQQQQQEWAMVPCNGVRDAGPLGAGGPGTGRVGCGGMEEEQLALGAEQEGPAYSEGKLLQAVLRVPSLLGELQCGFPRS